MNLLPIVLLLFVFGGGSLQGMTDLLSRIDLSSFSPLFPFLGIDKKTADFLCGEEFSSLLEGNADVRSLLPVLGKLFLKKNENTEEKNGVFLLPITGMIILSISGSRSFLFSRSSVLA